LDGIPDAITTRLRSLYNFHQPIKQRCACSLGVSVIERVHFHYPSVSPNKKRPLAGLFLFGASDAIRTHGLQSRNYQALLGLRKSEQIEENGAKR